MDKLPVNLPPTEELLVNGINSPTVQTIGLVIFGFFMLILIGFSRRFLISSSLQGVWAGIVIGLVLVLGVQAGFVWTLKRINTEEVIVPDNIRMAFLSGQQNVVQVLGAETEMAIPTAQGIVSDYVILEDEDKTLIRDTICKLDESEVQTGQIQ